MKKTILILVAWLFLLGDSMGQSICPPSPSCLNAPLMCGFALENDVFNNDVPIDPGNLLSCQISLHNTVWFKIMPCSPQLELTLNTLSTLTGDGLQIALFDDCVNPVALACNPGQLNGAGIPLLLLATVNPGQTYLIMVDGYIGDVCDFQFDIISGIDTFAPLPSSGGPFDGTITGPSSNPCSGIGVGTYTVTWPGCNTWTGGGFSCQPDSSCTCIHWTLPVGASIIGDPCAATVTIIFSSTQPGNYVLKATPECTCGSDLCSTCGPICCPVNPATLNIFIGAPQILLLPEIKICNEDEFPDCVYEPGGQVGANYAYCQTSSPANCLLLRQPYRREPFIYKNVGTITFCDSIWMCGILHTQPGFFTEACTTPAGCDSIVGFTLVKDPNCVFNCLGLNQPAPPADSCHSSPFFCGLYLENFCGSNEGLTDDTFGNMLLEKAGYIRFLPCSDSVVFRAGVSNCVAGGVGLSFGLYEGQCPGSDLLFSENIFQNKFDSLIFTGLNIDSIYTLVVSGINGSECQFSLEVLEGIGTAQPAPVVCTCVDGYVTGPSKLCPGDIGTYTLVPPVCNISGGQPIGGNGYLCETPFPDSVKLVWHIPTVTHFVGDSTGYTIQIAVDSALFALDTSIMTFVTANWVLVPTGPKDTLSFCITSADDGCKPIIRAQEVEIFHEIDYVSCTLDCTVNQCNLGGQIFSLPGSYIIDIDNCHRVVATVLQDFNSPLPAFVPSQTICAGETAQLSVAFINFQYFYFWSNGATGPTISVSPTTTTTYTILTSDTVNGCISFSETTVTVVPTNHVDFGEIGVLTCIQPCLDFHGQTYCLPGTYTIATGPCSSETFIIGTDPSIQVETLPDINLCEGACYDFYGQSICKDSMATHEENCTLFLQHVIVNPLVLHDLGVVGSLTCASPCLSVQGVEYCLPGTYSVATGLCSTDVFEIVFEKEIVELAQIGVVNCAESCVVFEGQNFCQPGNYSVEDACTIKNFSIGESFSTPECTPAQTDCLPNNTQFTVGFSIAGLPPYKVNTTPINGTYFLSAPMLNGTEFAFVVEQANGCQTLVNGTFNCSSMCVNDAGMLSAEMLQACAGQSSLQANSVAAATLAPGDVLEYWLMDATRGIISQNATGEFAFDPGVMVPGETYFIQRVVGTPDPLGHPDLSNPCTDTSSIQPLVYQAIPMVQALEAHPPTCFGEEDGSIVVLPAGNLDAFHFSLNGGPYGTNAAFDNLPSGTYSLSVQNIFGCATDSLISLPEPKPIDVNIGSDYFINIGKTITLYANTTAIPTTVNWWTNTGLSQTGSLEWALQPMQPLTVFCEIADSNGCTATDEALVFVSVEDGIYRPNILNPGSDQVENRYFTLYTAEGWIQKIESMGIYDRWGEMVWQGRDFPANLPNAGWDGSVNGSVGRPGVYVYLVVAELANGEHQTFKGDVTLVR